MWRSGIGAQWWVYKHRKRKKGQSSLRTFDFNIRVIRLATIAFDDLNDWRGDCKSSKNSEDEEAHVEELKKRLYGHKFE